MNFELTDDQRMLQEMLTGLVGRRYGFEQRTAAMREPDGFSRAFWAELAELGILGLPFAEEDGGLGAAGVETMVVMEALGAALAVEPFLGTVILSGGVLRRLGTRTQKAKRLPAIIAGDRIMALAHHEPRGRRHSVTHVTTTAVREGGGWRIDGAKTAVIAGAAADELIVSARGDAGLALFLIDPGAPGVTVARRTGYDGTPLADIAFAGAVVPADALLGGDGSAEPALIAIFEEANAALCAEAVGIMADVLATTTDYLKTRTQFGVAIGTLQALQHRAVDILMEVELARSMAILAALALTRAPAARALDIAAAKARIGIAGRFVGQQAVQLHGAIGLTEEYEVGHAFKRLTAIDALFGDADHHLDVIAEAGGLVPIG